MTKVLACIVLLCVVVSVVHGISIDIRRGNTHSTQKKQEKVGKVVKKGGDSHKVDLFFAYMDEETFPMLTGLMDDAASGGHCKHVYIIERRNRGKKYIETSAIADHLLFQHPLLIYPRGDTHPFTRWRLGGTDLASATKGGWQKTGHLGKSGEKEAANTGDTAFEKTLLKNMLDRYISDGFVKKLKDAKLDGGSKSNPDFPELILYKWDTGKKGADDGQYCVIARSPEMGLQPVMSKEIFQKEMELFDGETNVYAHGAGGATRAPGKPLLDGSGCMHHVRSAVWIGAKKEGDKYQGQVELTSLGGSPQTIMKAKVVPEYLKAIDLAKGIYHGFKDGEKGKKLKDEIAKLKTSGKGETGTAGAYFLDAHDKQASNAVGSVGANMEDAEMIDAMTGAKKKVNEVWRDDADPYSVDDTAVKNFNDWAKKKSSSIVKHEELVELILWSLRGMNVQDAPSELCWEHRGLQGLDENLFIQVYTHDKKWCVANGVYMETATDLLEDGCGPVEIKDGKNVDAKFKGEFDACEKIRDELLAEAAKCSTKACLDETKKKDSKTDKLRAKALEFVKAHAIVFKKGGCAKKVNGGKCHDFDEKTECPVWVRDKWGMYLVESKQNKALYAKLGLILMYSQRLEHLELIHAGVDRMYYKSSNFPLMQFANEIMIKGKIPLLGIDKSKTMGKKFGFTYWSQKGKDVELQKLTCGLPAAIIAKKGGSTDRGVGGGKRRRRRRRRRGGKGGKRRRRRGGKTGGGKRRRRKRGGGGKRRRRNRGGGGKRRRRNRGGGGKRRRRKRGGGKRRHRKRGGGGKRRRRKRGGGGKRRRRKRGGGGKRRRRKRGGGKRRRRKRGGRK